MKSAVLLIDLQRDFLAGPEARMPVSEPATQQILTVANGILEGKGCAGALPIFIVNAFPQRAVLMNLLRRHAAIEGTSGAHLHPGLKPAPAPVFAKSSPSAFSNPELDPFVRSQGIGHLYVIGVMAEACVRSTVTAALRRDYTVTVIRDGVASNARWKLNLGLWAMRRAGAELITSAASPA